MRPQSGSRLVVGGLVAALALTIASCSNEPASLPPAHEPAVAVTQPEVWDGLVDQLVERQADLAVETVAILEDISATGEVTRAHLDAAAAGASACLEQAGITPGLVAPSNDYEPYSVSWSFDLGVRDDERADQLDTIGLACLDAHYTHVAMLYQDRPIVLERTDGGEREALASAWDCLRNTPQFVEAGATRQAHEEALHRDFLARGAKSCVVELGL